MASGLLTVALIRAMWVPWTTVSYGALTTMPRGVCQSAVVKTTSRVAAGAAVLPASLSRTPFAAVRCTVTVAVGRRVSCTV